MFFKKKKIRDDYIQREVDRIVTSSGEYNKEIFCSSYCSEQWAKQKADAIRYGCSNFFTYEEEAISEKICPCCFTSISNEKQEIKK